MLSLINSSLEKAVKSKNSDEIRKLLNEIVNNLEGIAALQPKNFFIKRSYAEPDFEGDKEKWLYNLENKLSNVGLTLDIKVLRFLEIVKYQLPVIHEDIVTEHELKEREKFVADISKTNVSFF